MKKNLTIAIMALVTVALAALVIWLLTRGDDKPEPEVTVNPARIVDIRSVAQLAATDIYSEETVVDTVGSKVICAIMKLRGEITFDVDRLNPDTSGDTVRVRLPQAVLTLREATDSASWEVVDTRSLKLLGSSKLTLAEENAVKRSALERARRRLISNGTVERARTEAARNLAHTLSLAYRRPVSVSL